MLFDTLKENESIVQILWLNHNQLDDECMQSLGEYIKQNNSIEDVHIGDNHITDKGISVLASYLDEDATFKRISLYGNMGITDKSTPMLIKMIEASRIRLDGLYGTSISQKDVIFVSLALKALENGSDRLDLYYSGLNDDNMAKICEGIKKFGGEKLREVDVEGNKITSKGALQLIDSLKACNSAVTKLVFWGNQLDDECMKALGEYIKSNRRVEKLLVGYNKITDKGLEVLAPYLQENTTLRTLNLGSNAGITDSSVPLLINILESSHIEDVNVWHTSITQKNAIAVPLAHNQLKYGPNQLDLFEKNLNDDDITMICEFMRKYGVEKLREIRLNNNEITSIGLSKLLDTLKKSKAKLDSIYLKDNYGITDESIPHLIEYIKATRITDINIKDTSIAQKDVLIPYLTVNVLKEGIEKLSFEGGEITDDTMAKICEAIKRYGCSKLKTINLFENKITSTGAIMLFTTLKECDASIEEINLAGNPINDECLIALGEFMQRNKTLKTINLENTDEVGETFISDYGMEILAKYLYGNKVLEELRLSGNTTITDESFPLIIDITKNTLLKYLFITDTSISEEKQMEIDEALKILPEKRFAE